MKNSILLITTDWGQYEAPADIAARWDSTRKRLNGRLDRRFKEGKALTAWELDFIRRDSEKHSE